MWLNSLKTKIGFSLVEKISKSKPSDFSVYFWSNTKKYEVLVQIPSVLSGKTYTAIICGLFTCEM